LRHAGAPVARRPVAEADAGFERVCARSPLDGVLECRVSLQPELETRLRHLLELTAARPELFAAKKPFRPATAASFALLSGETGEILAQGTTTPDAREHRLRPDHAQPREIPPAARDDRDLTGARLARERPAPRRPTGPSPSRSGRR
jgi:hypothetical protein